MLTSSWHLSFSVLVTLLGLGFLSLRQPVSAFIALPSFARPTRDPGFGSSSELHGIKRKVDKMAENVSSEVTLELFSSLQCFSTSARVGQGCPVEAYSRHKCLCSANLR